MLSEDLLVLLAEQGGVVLHGQALAHGVRRCELGPGGSGRLLGRVRPEVYALSASYDGASLSLRTAMRVAAERAVTGVDLVAVGRTAALIHELPFLGSPTRLQLRERLEERPRHHGTSVTLTPADIELRLAVPVTALPRTALDVARHGGFAAGVVIADAVLAGGTSRESLEHVIGRAHRWPGVAHARRAAAFADARSGSALESLGRVRLHEDDLPPPELQVMIADVDGPFAWVDHYWEQYRTVGEADGALKYDEPGALFAEKRREDRIRDTGLEVVRYTWDEALHRPTVMTARFRRAFSRQTRRAS